MDQTKTDAKQLHSTDALRAVALLVLVATAEWLFYGQPVGLSLALFAALLGGVLLILTGHRNRISLVVLALACVPVIEDLNPLSATILLVGLTIFTLRTHAGVALAWQNMPLAVAGFIAAALPRAASDAPGALRHARQFLPDSPVQLRRNWAMPLGLGLCFTVLLTLSNPILQTQAERLLAINLEPGHSARHLAFWLAIAAAIWPFLARPRATRDQWQIRVDAARLGINAVSVSHALILFNALFAVQTVLDLTYLWAGTTLPDGMTHATYAHRGAYPLLATAVLAGAFTLISRRFAQGQLRALLLIWIAQNMLLVVSALYRLDLYIDSFGLTYLRIAAAIWMGLVAAGLCLTAWQILRRHHNAWLVLRCALLGLGTLYACTLINFAHIIATVNLKQPAYDRTYVCNLGPDAAAALRAHALQNAPPCPISVAPDFGWRGWSLRSARVGHFLLVNPDPRRTP